MSNLDGVLPMLLGKEELPSRLRSRDGMAEEAAEILSLVTRRAK